MEFYVHIMSNAC